MGIATLRAVALLLIPRLRVFACNHASSPSIAAAVAHQPADAVEGDGGRVEDVVAVRVEVPRDWLKRHGNHSGLWRCSRDVPPSCFRGIAGFRELSASPVTGAA